MRKWNVGVSCIAGNGCRGRGLWAMGVVGLMLFPAPAARAQGVLGEEHEMNRKVNYDEIIMDLIKKLSGTREVAMDASQKLGNLGSRAVPLLAEVLKSSKDEQERFYAATALTRIRHPSAAQALLPILKDKGADRNLRIMAIQAASADDLEDSMDELLLLAADPKDGEMRFTALRALSVMPKAWERCEALYVNGLSDERDDIRQLSAKVCYQVATRETYYYSSEPRLLELAEKEFVLNVRCNAMSALGRMKSRLALPVLVRVLGKEETPIKVVEHGLRVCHMLTGVPFRNKEALSQWWEKFGKERYADAQFLKLMNPKKEGELPPVADAKDNKGGEVKGGEAPKRKLKALPEKEMEDDPLKGVSIGE